MKLPAVSIVQFALCSSLVLIYLFFQLHLIPKYSEKTHYQVLGVEPDATIDEIKHAYEELYASRISKDEDENGSNTDEIQHAYEILSDPYRRRDYDAFQLDELKEKPKIPSAEFQKLPIWEPFNYEPSNLGINPITTETFEEILNGTEPWLIQIYSVASRHCWNHEKDLAHIYEQIDGVAKFGRVELGDIKLASHFADKNSAKGVHFFRKGLPLYVAFPSHCRGHGCIFRYTGKITANGVLDWMATEVLQLPRILYYSPKDLVNDLFQKSGPHKVKVVIFSTTGERAAPFFRKAANDFWDFAAFGLVLWREENATLWENMLGVRSAPAVAILRDPDLMPTIVYGKLNSSILTSLLEDNKNHVLPQLRSVTAKELGCSEVGYSLAGQNVHNWYCVIVAGRPSLELNRARALLRDVKDNLTKESSIKHNQASLAVKAFGEKRLTLAWLDGSVQKAVCYFYLNSENVHESCGAKSFREQEDVPRIFIIRYRRHPKDREKFGTKKKHVNNIWQRLLEDDDDLASQIVAKYNGLLQTHDILSWVSMMIEDGDSQDLLFYMKRAPALVPEEPKAQWISAAKSYTFSQSKRILETSRKFYLAILDYFDDPRFLTTIVLVLILYGGGILLSSKRGRRKLN